MKISYQQSIHVGTIFVVTLLISEFLFMHSTAISDKSLECTWETLLSSFAYRTDLIPDAAIASKTDPSTFKFNINLVYIHLTIRLATKHKETCALPSTA